MVDVKTNKVAWECWKENERGEIVIKHISNNKVYGSVEEASYFF